MTNARNISFMQKNGKMTNLVKSLYTLILFVVILFGINSSVSYGQDIFLITGTIIDGDGKPIENVACGIEGSDELPDYTDAGGNFTLLSISGDVWLNISPPDAYKTKRVFLNNRTELKIVLTSKDLSSGDDKIMLLSQDHLRRNLTSSFYSLKMENVDEFSNLSVDQFMQGKIPGLQVINGSGRPGSGAFSTLRGIRSINASNQPVFVVDGLMLTSVGVFESVIEGFEYNPLLITNLADISKITVLKDPALTAAYGSRSSNGVVLIETLDPSATQTTIDFSYKTGISFIPQNFIPQLDGREHKTLMSEVLFSSDLIEEEIAENYPNLFLTSEDERYIDYQHNTNWQSIIFDQSSFKNIGLMAKGGDEIARYGLSFGYQNYNSIIKSSAYNGYNFRFTSLLNIFSWLKMNAGVALNYSQAELKESAKSRQTSPVLTSLFKSPLLNPHKYDDDGREITELADVDELGVSNPKAVIDNFSAANTNFQSISTLGAEATINKHFSFKTNFSLTYGLLKEDVFMPNLGMELYYNDEAINVTKYATNTFTSFNNNNYLKYNRVFGNHSITSNSGINFQLNDMEFDYGLTKNSPANDQYRLLNDGTSNLRELSGNNRNWNWASLYENVTYSFRDKYIVNGSLSLDGSSRVGDYAKNTKQILGAPFGLFYGGGLGWRISNESFLKNLFWLEELKLRVSYGKTGNDDIGESSATKYYNAIKYRQTMGLYPGTIFNQTLSYEIVNQSNIGADISLFGNRFSANVDLFSMITMDMLEFKELEVYYGYSYRPENSGDMKNSGMDVGVFLRLLDKENFKWDVNANLSLLKNEIINMEGDRLITKLEGAEVINMEGVAANSFYGFLYEGVFSTTEEALNANLVNQKHIPYRAGDARFTDLSGPTGVPDFVIDDFDKTVLGSAIPEFFGGVNNTFKFKNWTFNAFVQFVQGNEIFNYIRYKNESMSGLENQSTNVLNRWQYEGQVTDVPKAKWNDPVGNTLFSSRWIEDGSYIRLKSLSLSYTVNNQFLAFRNAKIFVSAQNIFTKTDYLGYDPDFSYSRSSIDQGIDYGLTPQPRQFLLGVKLGL